MPFASPHSITLLLLASSAVVQVAANDVTDWVGTEYIVNQRSSSSSSTAKNTICKSAASTAKQGPWSVTNQKNGLVPPSGQMGDYLSWAPYHWPDCNWCTSSNGRMHIVHNGSSTSQDGSTPGNNTGYEEEAIHSSSVSYRRMNRVRWKRADGMPNPQAPLGALPLIPIFPTTTAIAKASSPPQADTKTKNQQTAIANASSPPQAPTKTKNQQTAIANASSPPQAATKTKNKGSSCTPSPTKPLPPSATWTTCPYVVRDGQLNPDVRTLNGPSAIQDAAQSIIYNSVCFGLQGPTASQCSHNAASAIVNFFLTPSTRMNPNMNFGQVVRGPGPSGQQGTFTGMLDLRGIVKIVNGLSILRAIKNPDWTDSDDSGMNDWMNEYSRWLQQSDLGQSTASKANNHNTFYTAQLAAVLMGMGENAAALAALDHFFGDQYQDQIAASGEQPLEAVRTRPYHYRCFNLEALFTLAKLGDYLGRNYWTTPSRYGANIQRAVDFLMTLDPKNEDGTEACPHVAAAAAAYGDPKGKYAAFLKKTCPDWQSQATSFYDQPSALKNAPSGQKQKKRVDTDVASNNGNIPDFKCPLEKQVPGLPSPPTDCVVLDDDICAPCEELKPFYEIPADVV